jgi:PEP-CTERM motif
MSLLTSAPAIFQTCPQPFSSSFGRQLNVNNIHKHINQSTYMKKAIRILVSVACLPLPAAGRTQGTLYVSNLLQTPIGSAPVASDSWLAQPFVTGTNAGGYMLNSIQLLMDAASGSPNGFAVSIYTSSTGLPSGQPYNSLGNIIGSDPSNEGIFTYTASGLTLSPSTAYYIVLNATTPAAPGAFVCSITGGGIKIGPTDPWTIPDVYDSSADGSSWTGYLRQVAQIGTYATPIPEPSALAVAGLGLAALRFWRRKPRR